MTEGVGKLPFPTPAPPPEPPKWIGTAGPNLARAAQVSATGHYDLNQYPVSNINDGRISYTDNRLRWVSDTQVPDKVELMWDQPQTIGAVRLVTGQSGGNEGPRTPITRFVLQYHDGTGYRDIPETRTENNGAVDWHARFPTVTSDRLRLVVTQTPDQLTRIWEFEVYGPPIHSP